MARLFLGVDGGQSSTTALIGGEDGRVLGVGRGGPCNHVSGAEGRAKFIRAIGGCVDQACEEAGLGTPVFDSACLGFSGGPADKAALVRELIPARKLFVTNDALIALSGACAGEPGVIAIGGTGSIAYGRNHADRSARVGGWGYIFGDEGGAFDIVRQAVRAALRFEEGWGPATNLRALLLDATGTASANELMHLFYTVEWPRSRVAKLSKRVDDSAQDGDTVAAGIMDEAALHLAALAGAVRTQLFETGEAVRVCYIGGVFRSARVLEKFRAAVEIGNSASRVGPPIYGPAAGALIEAYRLAALERSLTNLPELEK